MVRVGDIIENPVLGDTIKVLRTGRETNGELFQAEISLEPHAVGPPLHVHPAREDRFIPRSGLLGVQVGDETRTLSPGEEAVAPPGVPHRFWNAGEEPARPGSGRPAARLPGELPPVLGRPLTPARRFRNPSGRAGRSV